MSGEKYQIVEDDYDVTAKISNEKYSPTVEFKTQIESFCSTLPPAASILIVGATLDECNYFIDKGHSVTNIDIASKMIDYISARQTKVKNIKCNILDYSAEQYDGVWASRSLIHIPPKDFEKALKQISGCLKPSGMLAMILLLTNSETLVEQTGPNLLANRPEVTSYRVLHSEQSATAALKTTGYSIANKVTVTDRDNEACIYFEALARNDL